MAEALLMLHLQASPTWIACVSNVMLRVVRVSE